MSDHTASAQKVLQALSRFTPLSEGFQTRAQQQLTHFQFSKNDHFHEPGHIGDRIYFLESGIIRSYHYDEQGKQNTSYFRKSGDFVIPVYSFFTQKPSYEYLQALTEVKAMSLTYLQLQSFYADFPEANLIGRMVTEHYYVLGLELAQRLRQNSHQERYQLLIDEHPDIEQHVSQKIIASHLSIAPETLSRMKTKQHQIDRRQ